MKSLQYHYDGILSTFKTLSEGKLLIFFLPGGILTGLYLWFTGYTGALANAVDLTTGYSWIDWFDSLVHYVFGFFSVILDQIYIFFILTILSPFNTILGEKFDEILTGRKVTFNFIRLVNDFFRMIFVVIIIVFIEFIFLLLYWIISWVIPDFIDEIIYKVIAAFFFGFSFYDFSLERYQVGVFGSLGYAFRNPMSMILTGGVFLLIYSIPLIGIPLSPVIAVMVSTVVYLYLEKKLPKNKEIQKNKELPKNKELKTISDD